MTVGPPDLAERPGDPSEQFPSSAGFDPAGDFMRVLPAAMFSVDTGGRLTAWNEAAAELWGQEPRPGDEPFAGAPSDNDESGRGWRLLAPDGSELPEAESPLARSLRDGLTIRGAEMLVEKPDGVRVPLLVYCAPLRDGAGTIRGAAAMLIDITDRRRSELAGFHLASIVESSQDAIISKDINGVIATWNAGAEALFLYTAQEAIGQHINLLIPPDRRSEETQILDSIRRGKRVEHFETIRQRKDGSLVDISLTISPVRDRDGRIVGASKIARDISERRQAEEQQRLLLREMSHRIKNLFAVAGSLVAMSARTAASPAEMAKSVRARLDALNRAHDLTRPGLGGQDLPIEDTTLAGLLAAILQPYAAQRNASLPECATLSGPDIRLGGAAVTSFALIFHELATNAAKYGALSEPGGRVDVSWTLAERRLLVCWRETGGPPVAAPPAHKGFGSTLTERILSGQFAGRASYDWDPTGVSVRLDLDKQTLGYRGPI